MEKTVDKFETLMIELNDALGGVKKAREQFKEATRIAERATDAMESAATKVVDTEKRVKAAQVALNAFVAEGLVDKQ